MSKDYYNILGVSESASKAEIKKAFRSLAKKHHPDRHKGDKSSEQRFKDISEAYSTLSDAKKKAEYDQLRKYGAFMGAGGGGMNGHPGGDFSQFFRQGSGGRGGFQSFSSGGLNGMEGMEDILTSFFGGGFGQPGSRRRRTNVRPNVPRRGMNAHTSVNISFMESVNGTTRKIRNSRTGKTFSVKIPAGVNQGGKIRLSGQGNAGQFGGANGDLIITVHVMSDQNFERKGNDIYTKVGLSFKDAILGTKANVKTLTKTISLLIPPGTQPGTVMRLKGQGLAVSGQQGDMYVHIEIDIPKTLTDKQRKLLDDWEEEGSE